MTAIKLSALQSKVRTIENLFQLELRYLQTGMLQQDRVIGRAPALVFAEMEHLLEQQLETPESPHLKLLHGQFDSLYFAMHFGATSFLIGPFCSDRVAVDLDGALSQFELSIEDRYLLEVYLNKRPSLQSEMIENLAVAISSIIVTKSIAVDITSFNSSNATPPVANLNATISKFKSTDEVALRYQLEAKIDQAITRGDLFALERIIASTQGKVTMPSRLEALLSDSRYIAVTLNSLAARSCLRGGVSPQIVDYLSGRNIKLIDRMNNRVGLEVLQYRFIREYCSIVSRYNLASYSSLVKSAIEALRRQLNQNDGLQELASALHVSKEHLARKFKKETGETVSQYSNRLKIEESLIFVINKQHSIDEIAESLGFCSSAYYRKVFKQVMGCTPAHYCKESFLRNSES
ncbi:AraC family transcriptional regulator [Vibrio aestuarianus]|uniref:AraC family transcriptional regulator n=1 Tax=Vibrio aestuarianus TaxID=28171 RepID=A0AAX3U2J1_9VIBR|nr:AraC family transcriptional regulator [Vibrio aestuarianus]WGK81391.1 AraC family transcriptional regulator [Vibrio aestuarianus]